MSEFRSNLSGLPASRVQKRLRKGTHSCIECRRRKIRCNFQPGASICLPCSARGSRCISQQDGTETIADNQNITSQDKRPAVDTIYTASSFTDIGTEVNGTDSRAPIVSILSNPELLSSVKVGAHGPTRPQTSQTPIITMDTSAPTSTENPIGYIGHPAVASVKFQLPGYNSKSVCEILRSLLPSYDTLVTTISKNGAWWSSFRQKTHVLSPTPFDETLSAYAAHTYTSSNPAELGTLVTAYARSVDKCNHLYAIVDSLVLSDFAYSTTMEGMECLVLLAKSYTDIGQPRRAWVMWRRGIAIAQLMGLYREDITSPRKQTIWWSLYHGDRFASMLLGLPYGFNDAHFSLAIHTMAEKSENSPHQFVLRCAFIAGKVIDRNVASGRPSFAKAMDLDEQMEIIATSMPKDWWNLPPQLSNSDLDLEDLRQRLLQQFYFFHVRIYIHLPFLAKSTTYPPNDTSRLQCIEFSRKLLKRFQMLRTEIQGVDLFECKTSDFVGFTAAVVLIIGIYNSSNKSREQNLKEDLLLLASIERIFTKEVNKKECKLASQCQKTISILLGNLDGTPESVDSVNKPEEIRIPYFGTIVRRATKQAFTDPLHASVLGENQGNAYSPSKSQEPIVTAITDSQDTVIDVHMIDYMGNMHSGAQSFNGFPMNDQSLWLDPTLVDIDQDWNMFSELSDMWLCNN